MRRSGTFMRDLMWTVGFFVLLVVITFAFIWGEKALEAFKSH